MSDPHRELTPFRRWLRDTALGEGKKRFDPETGICLTPRDTCWYASALLLGETAGERREGNRILRTVTSVDGTHTPATMLGILHTAPGLLEAETAAHLRMQIEGELLHAAETEWHDGNVNHPLAAYCTLACGGAMTAQRWAVDLAGRRLEVFAERIGGRRGCFRRQAEMSEYNSLTYTALDLWFLSLMASCAPEPVCSSALSLEQCLWVNVALQYHAPSGQFAGPHSRSYHEDSYGGFSALHCTMALAMDIPMVLDPGLSVRFNHPSNLVQNGFLALLKFHPPPRARTIALEKPFPFLKRCTTYAESYHENSRRAVEDLPADDRCIRLSGGVPRTDIAPAEDSPFAFDEEVYPGGWSELTTFMTEDYALGSASLPYVNAGHADSVMLRIRRRVPVGAPGDTRSVWTRGVFNGALPGERNRCHVAGTDIDESYLYEEGRCFTYQHRHVLLVCYTPKRTGHLGVTEFRLDVQFSWHSPFDELFVDGRPAAAFPCNVPPGSRICWRDGDVYGSVIPFPASPAPAEDAVMLRVHRDFLLLSMWNYRGPRASFTRDQLTGWRTGCAMELSDRNRSGSFEAFLDHVRTCSVDDRVDETGVRRVEYRTGASRMVFACDPRAERIVSRTWEGKEECTAHLHWEAPAAAGGVFTPASVFGKEARG